MKQKILSLLSSEWTSAKELERKAKSEKISSKTLFKYLKELEGFLIEKEERKKGRPKVFYRINPLFKEAERVALEKLSTLQKEEKDREEIEKMLNSMLNASKEPQKYFPEGFDAFTELIGIYDKLPLDSLLDEIVVAKSNELTNLALRNSIRLFSTLLQISFIGILLSYQAKRGKINEQKAIKGLMDLVELASSRLKNQIKADMMRAFKD